MLEATKRLDWNWDIEHGANIFCPSPRSIDEMARFNLLARIELCGRDALPLPNKPDDLVRQKLHTHCLCFVAKAQQDTPSNEPTISGRVNGGTKIGDGH